MKIIERDGKQIGITRPSINLFAVGRRVMCIKNLSDYKDNIKESFVNEPFPQIGKIYTISSCRLTSKRSSSFNIVLSQFEMDVDIMNMPLTFKSNWFIPEQCAYNVLLGTNIDIKQPGHKEKIQNIYDKNLWKP